jgi:hypothetical protein
MVFLKKSGKLNENDGYADSSKKKTTPIWAAERVKKTLMQN